MLPGFLRVFSKSPLVGGVPKGGIRRRRDAAGAGAAATPAAAPRGSVDGALPLRIPFRAEKQRKSPKVPGRADSTRGMGKGIVNVSML